MKTWSRGASALTAVLALSAIVPAGAGAAESFHAVTRTGFLVTFQSDSPGAIRATERITGLRKGEDIVAIDVRPATGRLYGVTDAGRLYVLRPRTGAATRVTPNPFGPSMQGHTLGVDFNPVVDRLRVVSARRRENFRVDPRTGRLVDGDPALAGAQRDRDLAYDANDPAAGSAPRVTAIAYTNSRRGATQTQLFGIDAARDALVLQAPPDQGVLRTVGRIGMNVGGPAGLDVASDGSAWAAVKRFGGRGSGLYRVNLRTGRLVRSAERNRIGFYLGRTPGTVIGLAAAGEVPDDNSPPRVRNRKLNNPTIRQVLRGRPLRIAITCNEACRVTGSFLMGDRVVGRRTVEILSRRGRRILAMRLSRRGKRLVRRERPSVLTVGLRAVDAAGNSIRGPRLR